MSDKIGYEDLFDPNIQAKYKALTDAFVEGLKKYRDELKSGLSEQKEFFTGFKVGGSDDIKKLNQELENTNKKLADLTSANKAVEQSEKELAKLRLEEIKLMRSREKSIDDFTKKETNAAAKKIKLKEQERLSELQLQKAREKAFDQFEKQNRAYTKLSKEVRDLKNAYKDAAVAEGEMSKNAQDLLTKLTPLEQKLKKIDANVGDFQRNVGNYQSALGKFGAGANQVLGQVGLGVGVFAGVNFLKDSVQEFAKFESALQNLSAITGASGKDLEFYSDNAKKLGIDVKGGAAAVVEAYKLIGSAKPELLENKEALNEVTKAAITLSQASGLELPVAAEQLTQALNSFNAPAEDAGKFINVLAASAKFGAKEIPFVNEALSKFGGVAQKAGVSIETSAAAVELLGKAIPQAESVGTNLRGILIKLQTEAAKSGREFKGLSGELDLLAPRAKDVTYLTKVFGEQNLLAVQTLISERDELDKLTTQITGTGAAMEQAAVNTDTFAFKQQRLSNTFDALKQNIGEYVVGGLSDLLDGYDLLIGKVTKYDLLLKATSKQRKEVADELANQVIKQSLEQQSNFLETIDVKLRAISVNVKKGLISEKEAVLLRAQLNASRTAYLELLTAKDKDVKATKDITDETDLNTKAVIKNTKAKKDADARAKENYENYQKELQIKKDIAAEDDVVIPEEEAKKVKTQKEIEQEINDEKLNQSALAYEAQKKLDDEAAALRKEQREKERKEAFDAANQLLEIAEKRINQEQDLINDAIDSEINKRQNALDEQKRRAEQGLSSDIATAEKNLKDAEARKKEIEKEAIKRQQALTFFKLLSANAESDPNNALTKTFTEMLLSEALVKRLPGFFKGTENVERDLKGNKVHNGRDGHVIAVDGGERVMTGDQNKLMGGMANDDVANLVYRHNNNLLPNYMISEPLSPIGVAENMYNSIQLQQLVKQNEELIKAVKSIPGTNIMFADGKMKRTDNVNGFKTTTIKPLTRGYDN